MKSYIIGKINPGNEGKVLHSFNEIEEVKTVQLLLGGYDIFAEIHVNNYEALKDVIFGKVRSISGLGKIRNYLSIETK